jgi:outer membrane protein assembly factor BamB
MQTVNPLVIGSNGAVAAIDPASGNILWKTVLKTGNIISATSRSDISVVVQGSVIFAGGSGHLFCLDLDTGRVLWHNPLKGFGYNDVSMAMAGISVQYLVKVEKSGSSSGSDGGD